MAMLWFGSARGLGFREKILLKSVQLGVGDGTCIGVRKDDREGQPVSEAGGGAGLWMQLPASRVRASDGRCLDRWRRGAGRSRG